MKRFIKAVAIVAFAPMMSFSSPFSLERDVTECPLNQTATAGQLANLIKVSDGTSALSATTLDDAIDEVTTSMTTDRVVSVPLESVRLFTTTLGTLPTSTLSFTDGEVVLSYAAGASSTIMFSVSLPETLDDTKPMYVDIIGKSGTTDDPTVTLYSYWGNGTSNNTASSVTDTTGILTATAASYTITIAAADVADVDVVTFKMLMGAHTTDAVRLYAIRVRYSVTLQ